MASRTAMPSKFLTASVFARALTLIGAFAACAQEADADAAPSQQHIQIDVPSNGVFYNERGHLVIRAKLSNPGEQAAAPFDVVVVLLNDCTLLNVAQTCRFAAFGTFQDVAPDGIHPGQSLHWAFDFGPYPDLDMRRWSVMWYQVPNGSGAAASQTS